MINRKNGEWVLPLYKVIYSQNGSVFEELTHDKNWWLEFSRVWSHTEIIEFEKLTYTVEQLSRLEEVQNMPEGFEYYGYRYAVDGLFPDQLDEEEKLENHPFKILQLEKENQILGQHVTEAELKSMLMEMDMSQLGQQVTNLELQILMRDME